MKLDDMPLTCIILNGEDKGAHSCNNMSRPGLVSKPMAFANWRKLQVFKMMGFGRYGVGGTVVYANLDGVGIKSGRDGTTTVIVD